MNEERRLPVAAPALIGNERQYVMDCLESTWISSTGVYVDRFEAAFSEFCQSQYALTCSNGTVALHLALMALGVGPGDEVLVPTLTYVASANAVTYCGARPVFLESEPSTWNLDPKRIEERITPKTKAIIVVHLYGHPVDMDPVLEIASRHGLFVVEDAAEAHGARYRGKPVGSIGDVGTFSFYGNKILTTGEGGMVTTNSDDLAKRIRLLKGQGMDPGRRYWFPIVGYNYRMTNVAAAIGLAQLEKIDWHLERRRANANRYSKRLEGVSALFRQVDQPWAQNVYWINSVVLADDVSKSRDEVMSELEDAGIETRPIFYPMHVLPMYQPELQGESYPIAERLSARGINLPSGPELSVEEIDYVCDRLINALNV